MLILMDIKLLSGALGAEISGINLKDSSLENWNIINNLLLEHKALFFRNQDISSEEQINLAKRFGPLERHIYVKGRDKYHEILRIHLQNKDCMDSPPPWCPVDTHSRYSLWMRSKRPAEHKLY